MAGCGHAVAFAGLPRGVNVTAYSRDLAYIHDAAFGDFALKAAPWLLSTLHSNGLDNGLVIDLGCGSGHWARELIHSGYDVLGVDLSPTMIAMARIKVPEARFQTQSLWNLDIPPCIAVTALGECFNYTFDPSSGGPQLVRFFRRVFNALQPGGLFLFDTAGPERIPEDGPKRYWTEGGDWVILAEVNGDRRRRLLTRRIVCFRKIGERYRRTDETHRLRLYGTAALTKKLVRIGFEAKVTGGYGRMKMPPGIDVVFARKPR